MFLIDIRLCLLRLKKKLSSLVLLSIVVVFVVVLCAVVVFVVYRCRCRRRLVCRCRCRLPLSLSSSSCLSLSLSTSIVVVVLVLCSHFVSPILFSFSFPSRLFRPSGFLSCFLSPSLSVPRFPPLSCPSTSMHLRIRCFGCEFVHRFVHLSIRPFIPSIHRLTVH